MSFCIYILHSVKLNQYYIGTTDDIIKRLEEHNSSYYSGAYTSKGIPWELFFMIEGLASEQAYKMEQHIKRMKSNQYIINLKQYPEMAQKLRDRYL